MPKKVSRQSLTKATGSTAGVTGAGSRGTGRAKNTATAGKVKTVSRKSIMNVPSNPTRGMKGNQGPKRT